MPHLREAFCTDISNEGRQTFLDALDQLVHRTNGRFQYELPPDPRHTWRDRSGNVHLPPQPRQGMPPHPHDLQFDLTANSGSVGRTLS